MVDDHGTQPVPQSETKNWLSLGLIIWGIVLCLPAFMLGGFVAGAAPLGRALIIILLGAVVLALLSAATGVIGAHTRLSTAMSAKFTFGKKGFTWISIFFAAATLGWFGIQLEIFAAMLMEAIRLSTHNGILLPRAAVIIGGGLLMTTTAAFGFRGLSKLSQWMVPPLLGILLLTLFYSATKSFPSLADLFAKLPADPKPFGVLLSAVIGGMASGSVLMPDITRYAQNKNHAGGGMIFGMLIGFPLVVGLAAVMAAAIGQPDFSRLMLEQTNFVWRFFAFFTIIVATWTTNDNNLYYAALAANSLLPKISKWTLTLAGAALGIGLALGGILGKFSAWLLILGITLPQIGAVMAADFFLFRKEKFRFEEIQNLPNYRWEAWVAWFCGTAAACLTYFKIWELTQIPALDGMLVSFVIYILAMRFSTRFSSSKIFSQS